MYKRQLHNTLRWGRTTEDYLLTSFMGSAANLLTPNPSDPSTGGVIHISEPTRPVTESRLAVGE
ncbi:hypothetical protein [Dyella sp. ASV21]|uniref:hypothetical protein n=1 Tax=Dyella sp. ASV21 TaxID=2795114 RepID=UPI0018EA6B33|nr:hypothetical protein [Dyella sp. ASV21]